MKYRDFLKIIEGHGFRCIRGEGGSHRQYEGFVGGRRQMVTVAYHLLSDDIAPGTLASMIRQSGLPRRVFR
jgi:predicted RNA binding protein YcfA (HicA-like mRNA interferase family)